MANYRLKSGAVLILLFIILKFNENNGIISPAFEFKLLPMWVSKAVFNITKTEFKIEIYPLLGASVFSTPRIKCLLWIFRYLKNGVRSIIQYSSLSHRHPIKFTDFNCDFLAVTYDKHHLHNTKFTDLLHCNGANYAE